MIFNVGAGNGGSVVYVTQAEYDALPDSKLTNNVEYRIKDGNADEGKASNLSYDNSFSGLEANNVQTAIDKVNESLHVIQKGTTIPVIMSSRRTGGVYQGIIYSKYIGELTATSAGTYNDDNWAEITISPSNITSIYVESIKAYLISIAYTDCGGKIVDITFG